MPTTKPSKKRVPPPPSMRFDDDGAPEPVAAPPAPAPVPAAALLASEPPPAPVVADPPDPPASGNGSAHAAPPVPPPPPLQPVERMQETALVFLDDALARRLAVAWVTCRGDEKLWPVAAGMPGGMFGPPHQHVCEALKLNGICRPGGVTDKLALQYIAAIAAEPLHRMSRANKPKPQK